MELKLKRINLFVFSVFVSALLSAQTRAALVNGDFAQKGVMNAAALIAGDSTAGWVRSEWSTRLGNEFHAYVYQTFSDALAPRELDRFLPTGEDVSSRAIDLKLGENAGNQTYRTGASILQTFSLGTTDRLRLKLTDDVEAPHLGGSHAALTNVSAVAVPEPVPLTFVGIGALALVGIQALRRRRA
jgi:hypothetical protein